MKALTICSLFFFFFLTVDAQSNYIGSGIDAHFGGTTGDYVDLGDVFNDVGFPFTIEAWVKPTAWTPSGDYSPIFALDNNATGSYYGFWFRFNYLGKLIMEIGDGSGAGGSDRRGKMTTTTVSLNKWTHVCVVATSVSDIRFYFNGVLQPSTNTDGGATVTSVQHFSYPAAIGHHVTPTTEHDFEGNIDEVRLWNDERTLDEIRINMCKKLTGTEDGLSGYWKFDENYLSDDVLDFSTPAENGTINGDVTKQTSGAPIGDASIFEYTDVWSGVSMKLISMSGDFLRVKHIENAPKGMQIYRVDDNPYYSGGLNSHPAFYYGVFPVDGATPATYAFAYKYTFTNGVTTEVNEYASKIFNKEDGSVTYWNYLGGTSLDLSKKLLRKSISSGRMELIYNIPNAGKMENVVNSKDVKIFPNPATEFVNVVLCSYDNTEISYCTLFDESGKVLFKSRVDNNFQKINISNLPSGVYYIMVSNESGMVNSKKLIIR